MTRRPDTDTDTGPSDLDLVRAARDGSGVALAGLWQRHYPSLLAHARAQTSRVQDAEDLASQAFANMASAIVGGGGPQDSVSAYLRRSVRNLQINAAERLDSGTHPTADPAMYEPDPGDTDPVAARAELGLVREAFSSLPVRWRVVLWRTAVDRESNTSVAATMGLSANAVAALAVRARAGFRTAYLRAHLSRGRVDPECRPYLVLLPSIVTTGSVSPDLAAHLEHCARCCARAAELAELQGTLRSRLVPLVLVGALGGLHGPRPRWASWSRPRGGALATGSGLAAAALGLVILLGGSGLGDTAASVPPPTLGPALTERPTPTPRPVHRTPGALPSPTATQPPPPRPSSPVPPVPRTTDGMVEPPAGPVEPTRTPDPAAADTVPSPAVSPTSPPRRPRPEGPFTTIPPPGPTEAPAVASTETVLSHPLRPVPTPGFHCHPNHGVVAAGCHAHRHGPGSAEEEGRVGGRALERTS